MSWVVEAERSSAVDQLLEALRPGVSAFCQLFATFCEELRSTTEEVSCIRGTQKDRVKCPDLSGSRCSSLCEVLRRDHIGTGTAKRQTGCQVSAGGQQPLAPALRVIRHSQPVVVAPRLLNQGETQARDLKAPLRHSPPLAGPPSVDSAARLGALPGTGAHGSALRISRCPFQALSDPRPSGIPGPGPAFVRSVCL